MDRQPGVTELGGIAESSLRLRPETSVTMPARKRRGVEVRILNFGFWILILDFDLGSWILDLGLWILDSRMDDYRLGRLWDFVWK